VQAAAPFIQLDPQAGLVIDCDEGVRFAANLYGLPQKLLRNRKQIEEIKAAQDEANQKMLEAQQQQQGVEQVAKLAPAVKIASEVGAPQKAR
jgi:hypothetical protein